MHTAPLLCRINKGLLSHTLGADGTDSSESNLLLGDSPPPPSCPPTQISLYTLGSGSCGEPGRAPEVTWFSQLTDFLDYMFCRPTLLALELSFFLTCFFSHSRQYDRIALELLGLFSFIKFPSTEGES